jgi:alpha-tubulin suppressor-like RCC1 family protein
LDAGDWIDLGVSGPVSCALARDGKVTCFGDTTQPRAKPPSGYHLVSIDVGGLHACGLTADAKVVCWGKGLAVTGVPPSLAAPRIESPADASVDGPADASVD